MKFADIDMKYAALLIVDKNGKAYIYKPHWKEAVEVTVKATRIKKESA